MSDITDYVINNASTVSKFNDYAHLEGLCERLQIRMKDTEVSYGRGWAKLVEEMLTPLKSNPIFLTSITSTYGQLDTHFIICKGARTSKIYCAVEKARIRSRDVCMDCGKDGSRKVHGDQVIVICRKCRLIKENNGDTGTWLDKY